MNKQDKKTLKDGFGKCITLLKDGWIQGRSSADENGHFAHIFGDDAKKFCAAGAISRVFEGYGNRGNHLFCYAEEILAERISEHRIGTYDMGNRHWIVSWNDDPLRSVEDVISVFESIVSNLGGAKNGE